LPASVGVLKWWNNGILEKLKDSKIERFQDGGMEF
jgi:hypothetical protein